MNRVAFAVALAALPLLASAAEKPATATSTELAGVIFTKEMYATVVQQIGDGVEAGIRGHPGGAQLKVPADFTQRVRHEVEAILPYPELVQLEAAQLATNFSDAELKQLLPFYRSPLGQKSVRAMPLVGQAVNARMRHRLDQKMPEAMQKLAKLVERDPAASAPPKAGELPASDAPHGAHPAHATR